MAAGTPGGPPRRSRHPSLIGLRAVRYTRERRQGVAEPRGDEDEQDREESRDDGPYQPRMATCPSVVLVPTIPSPADTTGAAAVHCRTLRPHECLRFGSPRSCGRRHRSIVPRLEDGPELTRRPDEARRGFVREPLEVVQGEIRALLAPSSSETIFASRPRSEMGSAPYPCRGATRSKTLEPIRATPASQRGSRRPRRGRRVRGPPSAGSTS